MGVGWGAKLVFKHLRGQVYIFMKFQRGGAIIKHGGKFPSISPALLNAPMLSYGTLSLLFPVYFETYGCQMNVNDTEVAWSILKDVGYKLALSPTEVSCCH